MRQSDEVFVSNLEKTIGRVLFGGVAISTALLTVGLALWMAVPAYRVRNVPLQIGLVVLLVTPALRVLVSCVEYVIDRDWVFAGLTSIVLIVLLGSILAAFLG